MFKVSRAYMCFVLGWGGVKGFSVSALWSRVKEVLLLRLCRVSVFEMVLTNLWFPFLVISACVQDPPV